MAHRSCRTLHHLCSGLIFTRFDGHGHLAYTLVGAQSLLRIPFTPLAACRREQTLLPLALIRSVCNEVYGFDGLIFRTECLSHEWAEKLSSVGVCCESF